MYDSIHSFVNQSNDIDNVHQLLWLTQPSLTLVGRRDGFGLHLWDVTVEQYLRGLKVEFPQKCSLDTLMKVVSRSCSNLVRTDHSFDKDFAPSAISTNIRTYAYTTKIVLFCSGSYSVQHIVLHRGRICGDIPMHAPGEELEAEYARTLHRQSCHTLTIRCGQRYYRHLHRGVACKDYMGIANAEKKEDFRYCGFRHRVTVSLLSTTICIESQQGVADTSQCLFLCRHPPC